MGRKRKHGARENGEGEYPPAPVLESQAFESFYKGQQLVPESEWEDFMATLRRPLGVSFRITGSAQGGPMSALVSLDPSRLLVSMRTMFMHLFEAFLDRHRNPAHMRACVCRPTGARPSRAHRA
eukprot:793085-Pleurochrysis_carterae.AAC.4